MLGATHTSVLIEIVKLAGCASSSLMTPGGMAMVFGNLLPDNLPLVGVPPELSHEMARAGRLSDELPALGTGVMVHIYTDNLTHCDNVINDGNYGASIALKLGLALMEKTGGKYFDLVERFSDRSTAYTLHTIIELAADVLSANQEVVDAIETSWLALGESYMKVLDMIGHIYDVDPDKLREGIKKFPPENRPPPEVIYSRANRTELFLRKFAPPQYDEEQRGKDREEIMEMIGAGEKMLLDKLTSMVEDFAGRILDADPELSKMVTAIINSDEPLLRDLKGAREP